jgi:hypothetical protein
MVCQIAGHIKILVLGMYALGYDHAVCKLHNVASKVSEGIF